MNHDFKTEIDFDEYDPVEAYELSAKLRLDDLREVDPTQLNISNDEFLTAIFGDKFNTAHPLVCKKYGDPDLGGWMPNKWPCNTNNPDLNWYTLPSLYVPDNTGRYRAKKEFAVSVHAVMVDDVGTKVTAEQFISCPPSWAIETSPRNWQYGYILTEPITDLADADKLKDKLINAGFATAVPREAQHVGCVCPSQSTVAQSMGCLHRDVV